MSYSEDLSQWASCLSFDAIPKQVVAYAKSQLLSQLAAARTSMGHPLGASITRAFGSPLQADAKRSSYVLSALTMALDFDDAMYAGHVSHSTVNVPLGYAASLHLDGRALLTAIITANECAARIAAAATLGPFRGQMASYPHLAGAVAGRLRAEDAPTAHWIDALGLAFAAPPWNLRHAFLNSSAKVLTAASCVQTALDACDGAVAGLKGPPDIFEHRGGFLSRFAEVPLPETITLGLGRRWHTETLSFKCSPTSTGAHASVDCALAIHSAILGLDPDSIVEVVVRASLLTVRANEAAAEYVVGPRSPAAALQYTVPYCVATALLTGALVAADFATPAVCDPARWALADRVRVEHDPELTRRAIVATSPLGEALRQAGERASPWVASAGGAKAGAHVENLGSPSVGFENADKAIGARLLVRLVDGHELTHECVGAIGAAGSATRTQHPMMMRTKYLESGGSVDVADLIARLEEASSRDVTRIIQATFNES